MDAVVQREQFDLQRRSEVPASGKSNQGVITLSSVVEANKNGNGTQNSDTTQAPPAPLPSQVPQQV